MNLPTVCIKLKSVTNLILPAGLYQYVFNYFNCQLDIFKGQSVGGGGAPEPPRPSPRTIPDTYNIDGKEPLHIFSFTDVQIFTNPIDF